MIIERNRKEVVIRLSPKIDTDELQDLADYFRYKEITAGYKTDQSIVNQVASEINRNWYKKNRETFIK